MGIDKLSISISFLRLVFAKCSSLMFQFVNGDQREVPRDKSDKLIGSQSQCHGNLEAVWCVWYVWQFDIDAGHHPGASPKIQAGRKNISSRGFVSSAQYLFWEIVMHSFSWRTQNSINLVSVNFRKHQWISSWKIADYIHMYIYIPIYINHIPLSTRRLALALLGTGTALRPALQGAEANTLEQVTTLLRNIYRSIPYPKFMTDEIHQ